jgi:magnesium-transporting ATPase (P-type)
MAGLSAKDWQQWKIFNGQKVLEQRKQRQVSQGHADVFGQNTFVVSGSAKAVVVGTGRNTFAACMAAGLGPSAHPRVTAFDRAVRRIVLVFIVFIVVVVPVVIALSGATTGAFAVGVGFRVCLAARSLLFNFALRRALCAGVLTTLSPELYRVLTTPSAAS